MNIQHFFSFASRASIHFEELFKSINRAYVATDEWVRGQYEGAQRFPPFSLALAVVEGTVDTVWNVVRMYNERNHPQVIRLVQKVVGRIDAVTSTAVRFLDIYVYQVRDLVDYDLTYRQGHISYKQVR